MKRNIKTSFFTPKQSSKQDKGSVFLLTKKPVMYVRNEDDASSVNGNKYVDTVFDTVNEEKAVAFKAMNINDIKQVPCA